jgi:hypothetical protein
MPRTNSKQFRQLVQAHILAGVYDFEGDDTAKARHIWARFNSEFNYSENRQRTPQTQARVADWLSGLPLHIACANWEILELTEAWRGEPLRAERAKDSALENWFNLLAFNLLDLWTRAGIDPHKPEAQGCTAWPDRAA